MTPLPLHGPISLLRGFDTDARSHVRRLRDPAAAALSAADMAIVRSKADAEAAIDGGYVGALAIGPAADENISDSNYLRELLRLPDRYSYLRDGDLIGIEPRAARFRALYRRGSAHNSFLVTERCNHYCLMCSQPPRAVSDGWVLDEIRTCVPLVSPETESIGFTGGEPLLDWPEFIEVLGLCRDVLPRTAVHVLSNGRGFADSAVTDAWAALRHPNLTAGIPIYSAVDHVHNYVVQARGAFDETVLGVLKLKDRGQQVEIRVVLHAITAPRIVETCTWLSRNLPFVDHVALMGLENTGFAIANDALLWIDPIDYRDELARAVTILASAKVNVSVYNLPRCVLHRSVWPHAVQSISDWKNGYVEDCERCIERPKCSGFFTSGRPRVSRAVRAIEREWNC